jgi:hypothetical protein
MNYLRRLKQWVSEKSNSKWILVAFVLLSFITGYVSHPTPVQVIPVNPEQQYIFPSDYTVIKQQMDDLKKLNKELKASYEVLKSQGARVVTVTEIETVVTGEKTVYVLLPSEHTYQLNNGLPVAYFKAGEDYTFETYDLKFHADIIVTNKETGVKLTASSSGSDKVFDMPVTKIITHVEPEVKKPIFRPQLALTGSVSYPYTGPQIGLSLPLLTGSKDNVSWLAPTLTVSKQVKIGVAPIMFNVGKPLPLIDDLWIAPAYETDFINHYGALTIGTKL